MNSIKPYIKILDNKLIPVLNEKLGVKLISQINYTRTTQISYAGSIDRNRIEVKFSSNHIELKDYDKNYLYADVYYNMGGTSAGIIDLSNIDESVDQIYASLYELGFRNQEDLEKEKKEKEEAAEKHRQEEIEKEWKKVQRQRANQEKEAIEAAENQEANEDLSATESKESIDESHVYFDKYLDTMKDANMINSVINIDIMVDGEEAGKFKNLGINLYYISSSMCLVQTNKIIPKVDKAVTWDRARDYYTRVAEKLEGVVNINAEDPDGNELEVDLETDTDNTNVGIDL